MSAPLILRDQLAFSAELTEADHEQARTWAHRTTDRVLLYNKLQKDPAKRYKGHGGHNSEDPVETFENNYQGNLSEHVAHKVYGIVFREVGRDGTKKPDLNGTCYVRSCTHRGPSLIFTPDDAKNKECLGQPWILVCLPDGRDSTGGQCVGWLFGGEVKPKWNHRWRRKSAVIRSAAWFVQQEDLYPMTDARLQTFLPAPVLTGHERELVVVNPWAPLVSLRTSGPDGPTAYGLVNRGEGTR